MRLLYLSIKRLSGLAQTELSIKKNWVINEFRFFLECGVNKFWKNDTCLQCGTNSHNETNSNTCPCDKNDKLGSPYFRQLHEEQNWERHCFCMSNFRQY